MLLWSLVMVILLVCVNVNEGVLPLDMAPDSVDDMYSTCKSKMETKVKGQLLAREQSQNPLFRVVYAKALKKYEKSWKSIKEGPEQPLQKEQIMALYVYTIDNPRIYEGFNAAVRKGKSKYTSGFDYHTLHYYLTTAVQTLNSKQREKQRCRVGLRRVNETFSQDVLRKEFRFGSFTSSSMGEYSDIELYGTKSCFEIHTCYGAEISRYSKFGDDEAEILIPPYEVFTVTDVQTRRQGWTLDCDVVYRVTSTRLLSNLDCALFPK